MQKHWDRTSFRVGDRVIKEPPYLAATPSTPGDSNGNNGAQEPTFKFGRMFAETKHELTEAEREAMIKELVELGRAMNQPATDGPPDTSDILSGYTYLGQFIAHEITFDKTKGLFPEAAVTQGFRSPQIDLDSLYGGGPSVAPDLYQDAARLKIGETISSNSVRKTFLNDLPRTGYGSEKVGQALIADPRNDENLPLAQLHVAFVRFHNNIVDQLYAQEHCPVEKLFETARKEVVQHFQAIILTDFLRTLLDKTAQERLESRKVEHLNIDASEGMFMPLEFSVAAFRLGHSMVRPQYEWNYVHCSEPFRASAANLADLFSLTSFSGDLAPRLASDWIIDWRRFFDFSDAGYPADGRLRNRAKMIDATFDLHLDKIPGYPRDSINEAHRSITVRNLLRGFSFGLPTGEEIADELGIERISAAKIAEGPHKAILSRSAFQDKTPLWYYLLKEAALNNGKPGPVASCILVDTFLAILQHSPHSILENPEWRPKYGISNPKDQTYKMSNLLSFAKVVDPIGDHMRR